MKQWQRNLLRSLAATAALLALTAPASCSTGSSDAAGDGPATGSPAATPTPAAEIDQVNLEFVPALVRVKVGDVVLIKNSETAIHNAVIGGQNVTGNMMKGSAVPWTATAPGEYPVTCDYHPLMKATIVVTK